MSLTSELTKSDKGLYHVQICPAYDDDKQMTKNDWVRAAEILEQEVGYTGQKRAIVLHEKKGRIHAHVVWERYDHEHKRMIPNHYSRLAQDRARIRMEKELEHERTPERNERRPEMKEYLSKVWQRTDSAASFMKTIAEKGYVIAVGTQRPYMVIDEKGRSFDLVRQLEKVRTKEVRERFKTTKLVREKEAIEQVRVRQRSEKQKEKAKQRVGWEMLQQAANDNIRQITEQQQKEKSVEKSRSMQMSFTVEGNQAQKSKEKLKEVVQQMDEQEAKKKEVLERLKRAKLERAKRFRENERDL